MPVHRLGAIDVHGDAVQPVNWDFIPYFASTISLPPRVHTGPAPPSAESCHSREPASGNGRTYTSARPDSSELYAMNQPF